ncbi:hypothetical protein I3843_09G024000, partial [Carya illinoinensis]
AWRKMGISVRVGFMAVFAISGSVVLLAHQVHKRLLSDFMKRVESELGSEKYQAKKKVRFADDVKEPSSNNKEYRNRQYLSKSKVNEKGPTQKPQGTQPTRGDYL